MSVVDLPSLPGDVPDCLAAETVVLLERYAGACATAGIEAAIDASLMRAFALSPFIAAFASARAVEFQTEIASTASAGARDRADYDELLANALDSVDEVPSARRALRRLRQREISDFADACVAAAVRWLHDNLAPRFGRALDEHGRSFELLVIAMGKLGGRELNFSSDIDLIFVYGAAGETRGGRRALPHQDYFDRLGRELIAMLNETTADGFVFRVDMRLRPFGDGGTLTASLAALEHYYAVHGRDWERYALIKARAITGDDATRRQLEGIVRPFVFRRYLDYGALDALRDMKALINREASSDELRHDVKRGRGGIREIEFTGQLFQRT